MLTNWRTSAEANAAATRSLTNARALVNGDSTLQQDPETAFDQHMADYRAYDLQAATLLEAERGGKPAASTSPEFARMGPGGLPLIGSGIPQAGARGRGLGASMAAAVVTSMGHQTQIGAAFLTPSGSAVVSVPLRASVIPDARQTVFVSDLIPVVPAPGGAFAFLRQTLRTNAASVVAAGARKPTSLYGITRVDAVTQYVAHLSEGLPRSYFFDSAALGQWLEDEMAYGLKLAIDYEAVNGNGTPPHFPGILGEASLTQTFTTSLLRTTRKAVTQLQELGIQPSAWVLNPQDWEKVELEAEDQFAANPGQPTSQILMDQKLWSLPVCVSPSIAEGQAILGDFAGSAELHVTEDATLSWSENVYDPTALTGAGASDFEVNQVRWREEARLNLAVTRTNAFVVIDMGDGS